MARLLRRSFLKGLAASAAMLSPARAATGVYTVLDFMPVSLHKDILAGTSNVDVSGYVQAALDRGGAVLFPIGRYVLRSGLRLNSGNALIGVGGATAPMLSGQLGAGPTLLFTNGTGGPAIQNANPAAPLNYAVIQNMGIRVVSNAAYSHLIRLHAINGCVFSNFRAIVDNPNCHGFVTEALPDVSMWVNKFHNVQVQVPFTSAVYNCILRITDSEVMSCNWVGGNGAVFAVRGAARIIGNMLNNARGPDGCAARFWQHNKSVIDFIGNWCEQATRADILIDGDVQEGAESDMFQVKIMGGGTRSANLPASIVLKNDDGIPLRGPQIKGVSFIASTAERIAYDPARWLDVVIADNIG